MVHSGVSLVSVESSCNDIESKEKGTERTSEMIKEWVGLGTAMWDRLSFQSVYDPYPSMRDVPVARHPWDSVKNTLLRVTGPQVGVTLLSFVLESLHKVRPGIMFFGAWAR